MRKRNMLGWLRSMSFRGYDLGDLTPIVIAFTLIAIIGAVALLILGNFGGQAGNACVSTLSGNYVNSVGQCVTTGGAAVATTQTAAFNGLGEGISGINQIMTFLPLIALVVVAAVIIGVVVGAFVLGGKNKEVF